MLAPRLVTPMGKEYYLYSKISLTLSRDQGYLHASSNGAGRIN